MAVVRRGTVVMVTTGAGHSYLIEPTRLDLGLTLVEMVDNHLQHLTEHGDPDQVALDALLDARLEFAGDSKNPEPGS